MVDVPDETTDTESHGATLYGAVIGLLYVVGIGVQVFIVVDEVTHGALSDDMARRWRTLVAKLRDRRRIEKAVRDAMPWVRWEIEVLEQGGTP